MSLEGFNKHKMRGFFFQTRSRNMARPTSQQKNQLHPRVEPIKHTQKRFRCSKYAHTSSNASNILQTTRHPELITYQLETSQTRSLQEFEFYAGRRTFERKYRDSRTKKSKLCMPKRMNAFIAFRSFYSRQVKDYDKQISISRVLSTAWKTEKNKEMWRSYALLYNCSNSNIPFVDWLKTKSSTPTSTVTKSFVSWNELLSTQNKIEDVFLDFK